MKYGTLIVVAAILALTAAGASACDPDGASCDATCSPPYAVDMGSWGGWYYDGGNAVCYNTLTDPDPPFLLLEDSYYKGQNEPNDCAAFGNLLSLTWNSTCAGINDYVSNYYGICPSKYTYMRAITYGDCICGTGNLFARSTEALCGESDPAVADMNFSDDFFFMETTTTTTTSSTTTTLAPTTTTQKYAESVSAIGGAATVVGGVVTLAGAITALVVSFAVLVLAKKSLDVVRKGTEKAIKGGVGK